MEEDINDYVLRIEQENKLLIDTTQSAQKRAKELQLVIDLLTVAGHVDASMVEMAHDLARGT